MRTTSVIELSGNERATTEFVVPKSIPKYIFDRSHRKFFADEKLKLHRS